MPTGYTVALLEDDLDFPQFALRCARAFGALFTLRDESLDAPLPTAIAPSIYSFDAAETGRKRLAELRALNEEEKLRWGEKEKAAEIIRLEEILGKDTKENHILDAMMDKVRRWKFPTEEHRGLQEFMLDQCRISRHDLACWQSRLDETRKKPSLRFYTEAVSKARKDIVYYRQEHEQEILRTEGHNQWLSDLRRSLGAFEESEGKPE